MTMKFRKLFGLLLCVPLLVGLGCANSAIYFVEGTNFGVDATASAQQADPIVFSVAYKRRIAAVVPKACFPNCAEGQGSEEAVSMISHFSVRSEDKKKGALGPGWPRDLVIRNHFASGRAAAALTKPLSDDGSVVDKQGKPVKDKDGNPIEDNRIENLLRPLPDNPADNE